MNKLDYLAQKEEELRKLNEQLEVKREKTAEEVEEETKKEKDLFANAAWTVKPQTESKTDLADEGEFGDAIKDVIAPAEQEEPDRSMHLSLLAKAQALADDEEEE